MSEDQSERKILEELRVFSMNVGCLPQPHIFKNVN